MKNLASSTIANSESMPINNILKNPSFIEKDKEQIQNKQSFFSSFKIFYNISDKTEKKMMILGLICAIGTGITYPLFIFYIGKSINSFSDTDDYKKEKYFKDYMKSQQKKIDKNVKFFIIIGILSMFFHFFFNFFIKYVSLKQIQKLKKKVFNLLISKKGIYYKNDDKFLIGKIIINNFKDIEKGNCYIIGKFLKIISQTLIYLLISFLVSWKLSLMILFVSPLIFFFQFFFIDDIKYNKETILEKKKKINSYTKEIINNIITISSFANFEFELEKYKKLELEEFTINRKNSIYTSLSLSGIAFFILFSYCFGVLYGKRLIIDGDLNSYTKNELDSGDIFIVIISIIIFDLSIYHFFDFYSKISYSSKLLLNYNFNEIQIEKKLTEGSDLVDDGKFNDIEGEIKFENVNYFIEEPLPRPIICNLSLVFEKGIKNVIIGNNESGKTTILNLIIGLYELNTGNILIDNNDIKHYSKKLLRNKISYITQNPKILNVSLKENIILNRTMFSENLERVCEIANLKDLISSNNLQDDIILNENLTESQIKRIEIARAILTEPKIILIDDIDSDIDDNDSDLKQAIDNLYNIKNCTFIIVSNNLNTIKNAEKIFFMEKGNLISFGNYEQMKNSNDFNLYINECEKKEEKKELKIEYEKLFDDEIKKIKYIEEGINEININKRLFNEFLSFIGKHIIRIIILFISIFLNGLCIGMKFFILCKSIIALSDSVLGDLEDYGMIWGCSFILLSIFHFFITFADNILFENIVNLFCFEIRYKIFRKFFQLPLTYFDTTINIHKNIKIKNEDIEYYFNAFRDCIKSFGVFVICFPISFYFEWKITLMGLLLSIIYLLCYYFYCKISNNLFYIEKDIDKEKNYINNFNENIKSIYTYNYIKPIFNNFEKLIIKNNNKIIKSLLIQSIIKLICYCCILIIFCLIIHFSGLLIKNYHLSFPDLFFSLTLIFCMSINLKPIILMFIKYKYIKNSIGNIISILNEECNFNILEEDKSNKIIKEIKGKIEFKNVSLNNPKNPTEKILNNISFTIEEGKKICFIGLDNEAKKHILYLICGLYQINEGEILIDGENIYKYNLIELRKQIGLLIKNHDPIFNGTIYDNISYGDLKKEKEEIENISKICEISNLIFDNQTIKKENVSEDLEQKINITKIMIKSPQIYLIEGDFISNKELKIKLNDFINNKTSITILNKIDENMDEFDFIYLIHNGKIVEEGIHQELKNKNDKYSKYISFSS